LKLRAPMMLLRSLSVGAVIIAACGAPAPILGDGSLPVVSPPPGSHYEVLKAASTEMRDRMKAWVAGFPALEQLLRPYAQTAEGAKVVEAYVATNRAAFPDIWDELRGMADGSGLGLETIVLMQFRVELLTLIQSNSSVASMRVFQDSLWESRQECSDVFVNAGEAGQWHAHNEDAGHVMKASAYILNATFLDAAGAVQSGYLNFNYPLSTAGHSFGYNIHGIHVTENSVTPKQLPIPGEIGSFFYSRYVLDGKDFADVVKRANLEGIDGHYSTGASINVGSQHEGLMGNIEASPGRKGEKVRVEVTMVENGEVHEHFNMYLHSDGLEQIPQASSEHRLARARVMKTDARTRQALLTPELAGAIVSDTGDTDYPVYRTNATVETAATGLFDMGEGTLAVWFKRPANPNGDGLSTPDFKFDLLTREALPVTEPQRSTGIIFA